ncbi:diacylglycerol kinase family protein [Kitasatospora saccharophila]|uniref:diacylglycerol kinase family protein n=1 Tax=Kitasatospora saccharophila TaxID=407973 RepID=UPI003643A7DB
MTRTQGRVPPYVAVVVAVLAQGTALVAAGLLVTHPPAGWWDPGERGLVGWLAAHRTPALTTVSEWLSALAFTPAVVAVTAAVAALLLIRHRWRAAGWLAGAVALQATLFVTAAHLVDRARPDVVRLDGALPTSSFPSGHVGAATALYGGLGLLALRGVRGRWRVVLCALAWTVPVLVAASRLYRGMHHPTDVLFGVLNGAAALWVVAHALPARERPAPAAPGTSPRLPAALVHNPVAVDPARLEELSAVLAAHGYGPVQHLPGDPDDCGRAAAGRALAGGARLVAACGGDGTVTACAEALAGTDAVLAVVPCGTGNLLARNLGLPTDPAAALTAALTGRTRRIDLMRAEGDGLPVRAAAVMAGIGLDAAVMADTGRALKRRLGWPAYAIAATRHLRDRRFPLTVTVDDAPPVRRQVRTAVVGNVGTLQGGVRLLPDAAPDDGLLDLVLVQPHGPRGWSRALLSLLTGTRHRGPAAPLEHFRGRRIRSTADHPHPRECDGDSVGDGRTLTLTARPNALLVRVPATAQDAPAAPTGPAAAQDAPAVAQDAPAVAQDATAVAQDATAGAGREAA